MPLHRVNDGLCLSLLENTSLRCGNYKLRELLHDIRRLTENGHAAQDPRCGLFDFLDLGGAMHDCPIHLSPRLKDAARLFTLVEPGLTILQAAKEA